MEDRLKIRESLKDKTKDELISIIELLLPLIDRVKELEKEVARLKNQNSRNSSLPHHGISKTLKRRPAPFVKRVLERKVDKKDMMVQP